MKNCMKLFNFFFNLNCLKYLTLKCFFFRQEWVYPVDETLMKKLESLAYFCGQNENK